jgi:hypothetical protein
VAKRRKRTNRWKKLDPDERTWYVIRVNDEQHQEIKKLTADGRTRREVFNDLVPIVEKMTELPPPKQLAMRLHMPHRLLSALFEASEGRLKRPMTDILFAAAAIYNERHAKKKK